MTPVFSAMTDDQLRQLVHLLASTATTASIDRAVADIDAIGTELWRRSRRPAAEVRSAA